MLLINGLYGVKFSIIFYWS